MPDTMIELRRLRRHFGRTKAVDGVSFEVERGHVFGFIGPNGAGKTTSMRILATLDCPHSGDAFVDGFSVIEDPDRVRRRLGFMPDYYGTYPNMNVLEYLDFFARSYGLCGEARRRGINYVLDFTGLDKLQEKAVSDLSKGMKQRLCLGRTMIHDPPVLVLDEPTSGLDVLASRFLRDLVRAERDRGKAVIFSTHYLAEAELLCDRIGLLHRGRLLREGAPAELRAEAGAASLEEAFLTLVERTGAGAARESR